MSRFIELHEYNREHTPIYVNVDFISYIVPEKNGCYLFFCSPRLSSTNGGNGLQGISSIMEARHVVETYIQVKNKIDD